jgi:uncharacterized protein (DUF58 family)
MLDARLQHECEGLHRQAQRVWGRHFLGRRTSPTLAGGTEVTGYSDYTVGDDPRYIDWNLCARHDELRVKQFQGSEDNCVYLLVDVSKSMNPAGTEKFAFARRLTAALGYLALANLDRVSVLAICDRVAGEFPPLRGLPNWPRLLEYVDELQVDGAAGNLPAACDDFSLRGRRSGLAVLISDLLDPAGPQAGFALSRRYERAVDVLRGRRFEPYLVHLLDPLEADWQALGATRFVDPETGRSLAARLDADDVALYRQVLVEWIDSIKAFCSRRGVGYAQVHSDEPLQRAVHQMFGVATSRTAGQLARI